MSAGKELFQRKTEGKALLAGWWATVVNDPNFAMVLACARAEVMEARPPQAHIEGAELMLGTLKTLSDNEPGEFAYPSPGLHHHMPVKAQTNADQPKS